MTYYQISENIDKQYGKLTRKQKSWILFGIIALAVLLLISIGAIIVTSYKKNKAIAKYEQLLEKSKQNYYLQTVESNNLEKKLQDMSLRLAELKNSTIELERMFGELSEEKVNLEDIRAQMESGLRNTRSQLDRMQHSVNYLIDQRTKTVTRTEEEIIYEKSDTHGK